ncbi:MAG: thymidine phosphorylase [Candidatus Pacearchaeota archaeon]
MKLRVKFLKWSAGVPVVMLNKFTAEEIGIHTQERVSIKTNSKELSTIVDIIEGVVGKNEIAVSSELKKIMNLKNKQKVEVSIADSPKSLDYIKKKLNNKSLSYEEINEIIKDIVSNSLSEAEIALFISAMYKQGTSMEETIFLIKAMLNNGNKLSFKNKFVVDKHSIGGIPGRTTPIVVSICAFAGLIFPKTSSRAITTPAGTADVMETLARVEFSMKELKEIIRKTNACIVWGGGLEMVTADSKLIQIEKLLGIDPEAQLLASIMSKKLAMGSNYILIHIPYGKTAKVNRKKALNLKKKFEYLGKYFRKKMKVVLIESKGPLGNGVGPVLEMIDVIKVLNRQQGPKPLEEKSLYLAAEILEMTGKAKKGRGIKLAEEILYSGKALEKFKEIIKAQEGSLNWDKLKLAKFKREIITKKSGKILEIDNKKINLLARIAGCPAEKSSGIYIHFCVGDKIKRGEKIITIYSNSRARLKQAENFYKKETVFQIR